MRRHETDVAIVGTGLVAAVVARSLLRSGVRVLMLDSGSHMTGGAAAHLRNAFACQAHPRLYRELLKAHLHPLPGRGGTRSGLPAAATTSLVGGMGALWNGVAVRFDERHERSALIEPAEWDELYHAAEEALHVSFDLASGSALQRGIVSALEPRYGAARARPVPLAARRRVDDPARVRWTGPGEVLDDGAHQPGRKLRLLAQHPVWRLRHRAGRVVAVDATSLDPQEPVEVRAEVFVVAAGALRTPALLWNSDVHGRDAESAVGRYLTDHPVAFARLSLSPPLRDAAAAPAGDTRWNAGAAAFVGVPIADGRPLHSLVLVDPTEAEPVASLYCYSFMQPRPTNRLSFDGAARDAFGLPVPRVSYALAAEDEAARRQALDDVRSAVPLLGVPLPASPPQLLSAGSSMHVMGTTRMGARADGDSVVDVTGRVWGFSNLYVAGTSVIPGGSASNPTLTACALAIRSARAIAGADGQRIRA